MQTFNTVITLKDLPPPPHDKSGWPWTEQIRYSPEKILDWRKLPRISIITPSYNQGEFIEATIRSVLLQGYLNLEYIVIDGGSTDRSVEIIRKYEDHLFYWTTEKDKGQADAINKGIERSNGELMGWINSDDVYVKGAFHKVVKAYHSHPGCVVVHGDRILIDKVGDVIGWACLPPFDPKTLMYTVHSETAFWQRSAMEQAGSLDPNLKFAMDLEFFGRLYHYGNFFKINSFLGCFRCHAKSKSSTIADVGQEEAEREWRKLFGSENMNFKGSYNSSFLKNITLKNITVIIRYPQLIGLPYLVNKFIRGRHRHM